MALREDAQKCRKRQTQLAIGVIVLLAAGAIAVYMPLDKKVKALRQDILAAEKQLVENQDRAQTLPQLMREVANLRRQVGQYKPLRDWSDLERAMHDISSINAATQLKEYKIDMASVERVHANCSEQPVRIAFQADFVDAMSFIQKLEAMERLTRLRDLSIKLKEGADGKKGIVSVTMSMSLFFADAGQ